MTSPLPPPTKRPPPPPPVNGHAAVHAPTRQFSLGKIQDATAQRALVYGSGGIGKTTLACLAAKLRGPVGFIDLEDSLGTLRRAGVIGSLDIRVAEGIRTWDDLRGVIQANVWGECKTLVIDSGSRAEELSIAHTIKHVLHEKGKAVTRLEDYGFGKGFQHNYETFLQLFGDLDQHIRQGRNVVLVCHEVTANVPNPLGEDFLRYEPRLQHTKTGGASIRLKAKEWSDHVFFIGYDVVANEDGKAQGSGTRTIYPREQAWCMAKSRTVRDPVQYHEGDDSIWQQVFEGGAP